MSDDKIDETREAREHDADTEPHVDTDLTPDEEREVDIADETELETVDDDVEE